MRVRAGKCQHSDPSIEGRPEEEATLTSQSTLQIIQGNTSPSKASPPGTQPWCPGHLSIYTSCSQSTARNLVSQDTAQGLINCAFQQLSSSITNEAFHFLQDRALYKNRAYIIVSIFEIIFYLQKITTNSATKKAHYPSLGFRGCFLRPPMTIIQLSKPRRHH